MFIWSHPHGCVSWNLFISKEYLRYFVTPSRVCELKFPIGFVIVLVMCHTLTGVWVEIQFSMPLTPRHLVTPSRVCELKLIFIAYRFAQCCHTLTGVWVEINWMHGIWPSFNVTPSRVCELKFNFRFERTILWYSHTLTGVWVEISTVCISINVLSSHPHGCVSWNSEKYWHSCILLVTPSRVCELKLKCFFKYSVPLRSHPHGCVSWNFINAQLFQTNNKVTPSRVCELKCN